MYIKTSSAPESRPPVPLSGFWDWITGQSAPASVVRVKAGKYVDQVGATKNHYKQLRGSRAAKQVRLLSGIMAQSGLQIPKTICFDVQQDWESWGKELGSVGRKSNEWGSFALAQELYQYGSVIDQMCAGRSKFDEYPDNDRYWALVTRNAILADSFGAVPSAWTLVAESIVEASADVGKGAAAAANAAADVGKGALRWSFINLAPWVIGGAIAYQLLTDKGR